MVYERELAFAHDIAREAGAIMKKYYRIDQKVTIKTDNTPVTIADTEINELLIKKVQGHFPEYGVIGEEANWMPERTKLWVCDPIDGTVAFMIHVPTSMFSLAFVDDGRPVVGVAYNPWTDELYHAAIGKGAFCNGQPITVSRRKWGKEDIRIGSSSSRLRDVFNNVELVRKLAEKRVFVNSSPGLVHAGCTLAEGVIEGRIFPHHTVHDVAALKVIIEEAGGKVTDLDGNEQRYDRPVNGAIMSNGLIHEELIKVYADSRN